MVGAPASRDGRGMTPRAWDRGRPQGWARWAAWGALACALPSSLWRLLMIVGLMPGTAELRRLYADEVGYVVGLSVAELVAAALVVGLVQPWGEQLLGVTINRWVPVVLGTLGGLMLTWLFSISLFVGILQGGRPDQGTVQGIHFVVMLVVYAPMLLFGPLTLTAVVGYALRRIRPTVT